MLRVQHILSGTGEATLETMDKRLASGPRGEGDISSGQNRPGRQLNICLLRSSSVFFGFEDDCFFER
jgi:hypothetical protein